MSGQMNDTTFEQTYRDALGSLRFTDEQKAAMTARLEEALANRIEAQTARSATTAGSRPAGSTNDIGAQTASARNTTADLLHLPTARTRRRHHALRYAAAAALVAVLALGGTAAYATGLLRPVAEVFASVFGPSPAQTEVVDKIGHPIGATASSAGVTVTADAVIGDRTNYVLVFSVARDDGQPLDLSDAFDANGKLGLMFEGGGTPDISGVTSQGGSTYFYDADPSDATLQYVVTLAATTADGGSLAGRTARIHLGKLVSLSDDGELRTVADGSWNLAFTLDYEDATVDLPAGQTTTRGGMSVTIDSLAVSPIGVSASYTVDGTPSYEPQESGKRSDHNQEQDDLFMSLPLVVTFADGHTEDATDSAATLKQDGGVTHVSKSQSFSELAKVDDIVSVTIGDVTVPVHP